MLDSRIRPLIDPMLEGIGRFAVERGCSANQVTISGFCIGITTLPALAFHYYGLAFCLLILNRLLDGVDGSIARIKGPTDLGAYLDIVLDFIVYSAVVFGFCLAQPENALYGAFLIFSFIGTGTSFLAYAILAEKHNLSTDAQGQKSIYYLSGIAEGFETIVILALMCLLPEHFWLLALCFGIICWLSTAGRVAEAAKTFR